MNYLKNELTLWKAVGSRLGARRGDVIGKYYTEPTASHFAKPESPESNIPRRQSDSICRLVSASGVLSDGLLATAQGLCMGVAWQSANRNRQLTYSVSASIFCGIRSTMFAL